MIYVMGSAMYKEFTTGKAALTHNELVNHVNESFGLRGNITDVRVGDFE